MLCIAERNDTIYNRLYLYKELSFRMSCFANQAFQWTPLRSATELIVELNPLKRVERGRDRYNPQQQISCQLVQQTVEVCKNIEANLRLHNF